MGRKIEPVSQTELARLKGCTRANVSKAAKGPLAAARLADGTIDKAHPVVVEWLGAATDRTPTARGKSTSKYPSAPTSSSKYKRSEPVAPPEEGRVDPESDNMPDDGMATSAAAIEDMPFGELVRRFGTGRAFKLWTDGLKDLVQIRRARIQCDEAEELSVRREAMQIFIFGAIESTNRRLLRDLPKTLATRTMSLVKSGGTLEDCEKLIRDSISTGLSEVKATALRVLKREPKKDEPKKES